MNTRNCLAAIVTTIVIGTIALPPAPALAAEQSAGTGYLAEQLGLMQKESKLVGTIVRDGENHKLGRVEQFVVDLNSGRIYCALVSPSGNGPANEPLVILPVRSFRVIDPNRMIVDLKKSGMTDAPRFPSASTDAAAISKSMGEAYAHFHQTALWNDKTGLGQVSKSGSLVGLEVRNKAGENLGKLADLMVDLSIGRIIYAMVSLDGSETHLYAVPPTALALSSDQRTLVLEADKTKITALAQPDAFFSTDMTDPNWAIATYRAYGKSPDFDMVESPAPDLARENVPANKEQVQPSVCKLAGKSDSEISQSVMTAVVRDDIQNAFVCKGIKISTVNGHVTLSGRVKDPKQRVKFAAIAESIVGAGNVNNLLASQ